MKNLSLVTILLLLAACAEKKPKQSAQNEGKANKVMESNGGVETREEKIAQAEKVIDMGKRGIQMSFELTTDEIRDYHTKHPSDDFEAYLEAASEVQAFEDLGVFVGMEFTRTDQEKNELIDLIVRFMRGYHLYKEKAEMVAQAKGR